MKQLFVLLILSLTTSCALFAPKPMRKKLVVPKLVETISYSKLYAGSFGIIKTASDMYQVSFDGSGSISRSSVQEAIIEQAALIAEGENMPFFEIVGQISAHEVGGNHSGSAVIKLLNLRSGLVPYDSKLIRKQVQNAEKAELLRINQREQNEHKATVAEIEAYNNAPEESSWQCTELTKIFGCR